MATAGQPDNQPSLAKRLCLAESLLAKALSFRYEEKIQGMQRIEKQIKAEITMLNKLLNGKIAVKNHHLSSTNLLHLEGILHLCEYAPGVIAADRSVRFNNDLMKQVITIDIISNGGSMWIKLFARKRTALHKKWQGNGNFGDKTVTDFAHDYTEASLQNLYNFIPPKITFVFFDGVTESIAEELYKMNINVLGPTYPDNSNEEAPSPLQIAMLFKENGTIPSKPISLQPSATDECNSINLDVSTMLAWVSSITHAKDNVHFADRLLKEQAVQELNNPLWPQLQSATKGRELIACQTALKDFRSIVMSVGGNNEQERARQLISLLQEVPDQPSERSLKLRQTGKIKDRSKVIFGTGDKLKAITLTANEGFVRSAAGQGVHFSVIIHQSRALAEIEIERLKSRNDTDNNVIIINDNK